MEYRTPSLPRHQRDAIEAVARFALKEAQCPDSYDWQLDDAAKEALRAVERWDQAPTDESSDPELDPEYQRDLASFHNDEEREALELRREAGGRSRYDGAM